MLGVVVRSVLLRPHTFSSTSATISSITSISATSTNKLRSSMSSMSSTTGDRIHGVKQLDSNPILYGTAWKKERTTALVLDAINSGFRSIDTACQPKHYSEDLVGVALQSAYDKGLVTREEMFLQTKFTSLNGQDPNNVPYDVNASLEEQVQQSFAKSCFNLHTTYLDSLVLHSPMSTMDETLRVWHVFESLVQQGGVLALGISNTYNIDVLRQLYDRALVKPSFLQNRFYAKSGYDKAIRHFCKEKGIRYQSFWTLTGNPRIINSGVVADIAKTYSCTKEQVFYRYVQLVGGIPLSGTTSKVHMMEDLAVHSIPMNEHDVEAISNLLT